MRYLIGRLPALFLFVVAIVQVCLCLFDGRLAPDKAGGFGLFSTVDRMAVRKIRLEGRTELGQPFETVSFRNVKVDFVSLKLRLQEARSYPTEKNMKAVITELSNLSFEKIYIEFRVSVAKATYSIQGREVRMRELGRMMGGRIQ